MITSYSMKKIQWNQNLISSNYNLKTCYERTVTKSTIMETVVSRFYKSRNRDKSEKSGALGYSGPMLDTRYKQILTESIAK